MSNVNELKKLNPTAFASGAKLTKDNVLYLKLYENNIMFSKPLARAMQLNDGHGMAFMPSKPQKNQRNWDYFVGCDALGFELKAAKGGNQGCYYVNNALLVKRMCKDMGINRPINGGYVLFTATRSTMYVNFYRLKLETQKVAG